MGSGAHARRWDKVGQIMDSSRAHHDQYLVRVFGSNRVTMRNRCYLRLSTQSGDSLTETVQDSVIPEEQNKEKSAEVPINNDEQILDNTVNEPLPRQEIAPLGKRLGGFLAGLGIILCEVSGYSRYTVQRKV